MHASSSFSCGSHGICVVQTTALAVAIPAYTAVPEPWHVQVAVKCICCHLLCSLAGGLFVLRFILMFLCVLRTRPLNCKMSVVSRQRAGDYLQTTGDNMHMCRNFDGCVMASFPLCCIVYVHHLRSDKNCELGTCPVILIFLGSVILIDVSWCLVWLYRQGFTYTPAAECHTNADFYRGSYYLVSLGP